MALQLPEVASEKDRVLTQTTEELYSSDAVYPGQGIVSGAAVHQLATNSDSAVVILMPAASDSRWHFKSATRAQWPQTKLRITVIYSSPVAGGSTFRLNVRVRAGTEGSSFNGANLLSTNIDLPAPSAIDELMVYPEVSSGFTVSSADQCAFFRLRRAGVDSNANDLELLAVRLEFLEARR